MIEVFRSYLIAFTIVTQTLLLTASIATGAEKPKKPTSKPPQEVMHATDPNPRSLELNERGIAAMRSKDLRGAEESFRKAIIEDQGNLTAVFNLAGVYLAEKNHQQAIELLEDYTNKDIEDAGLYSRLGDAYFASKKVTEAKTAYEAAYRIAPAYEGLPAKLSTIYGLEHRMDLAEKMMLAAVEQSPKNVQNLISLANIYIANKKYDDAISSAKKALQLKATKEAYLSLGTAYEMNKDYKNSLIAFEKAVDLGENREPLTEKIKSLKEKMS